MAAKNRKKPAGKGKPKVTPKAKATPKSKAKTAGAAAKAKTVRATASKAKPKAKVKSPPKKKVPKSVTPTKSKEKAPAKTKPTSPPSKPTAKAKKNIRTTAGTARPTGASAATSPFKNFTPYDPKRGEHYMGADQLDHFRYILLKWRQELMEEVDRTVHHMQDEAANFPDPADRATQEEEFSIELRTRDRERKLIKKIDQTIERIDQEDYGYCDTCGVEIGLRRLEARPTATQCVDCKTLDEIKERQLHG